MVKRLADLGHLEREIIKGLKTRKSGSATIDQIQANLFQQAGISPTRDKVSDALGELIEYGSVRSYRTQASGKEERKYYLSRGLGSGARNQDSLYGKAHPFRDLARYLGRIFGSIFILFSLGVILSSGLSLTGNAILSYSTIGDVGLILSFLLGIIGFFILTSSEN